MMSSLAPRDEKCGDGGSSESQSASSEHELTKTIDKGRSDCFAQGELLRRGQQGGWLNCSKAVVLGGNGLAYRSWHINLRDPRIEGIRERTEHDNAECGYGEQPGGSRNGIIDA